MVQFILNSFVTARRKLKHTDSHKVIQDCSFCERVLLVGTVNGVQESTHLVFPRKLQESIECVFREIEIDTQTRRKISNLTSVRN